MSSNQIPYFYIIEHTKSGKFYAGAKWAKDGICHPDKFMKEDGYTTSSTIINEIISKEGLDAFRIKVLMTQEECKMDVYSYETIFLQSNNIAQNDNWFNKHNNNGDITAFFKTKECSLIWSAARKKYLEKPENLEKLLLNCQKLATNEKIQKIKSKKMSGQNNPMYQKTHSAEMWEDISTKLKGREVWNQGKTKESDERVKKHSEFAINNNAMAIKLKITTKVGEVKYFKSISAILRTYNLGKRYRGILIPGILNYTTLNGKKFSATEQYFNNFFDGSLLELDQNL